MLTVIIIDDEPSAITALKNTLNSIEDIKIIGEYTDSQEGISSICTLRPDIVFLDIEMPIYNGLLVAKNTEHVDYHLIYTTAYPEHALAAFDTNVTDYLLKPIRPIRLIQCIDKVRKRLSVRPYTAKVSLFDGSSYYNLNVDYINVIKSIGRYQQIYLTTDGQLETNQQCIVVEKSITAFEEELERYNFYRIHRSYIVNLERIRKIVMENRNKFVEINDYDELIPVSRSKFKLLAERYQR